MGQTELWLPRWWWQLVLLVWQRTVLRPHIHHKRHHRVRREFSRQYVLLHQERPSSRHRISRPAAQTLPNSRPSNSRRDRGCELWPKTFPVRHLRHDPGTPCFHKVRDLLISTARWPGRLDRHHAKVSNLATLINSDLLSLDLFLGWCRRI